MPATNRKFGVEIEITRASKSAVLAGFRAAGIECRDMGYNHATSPSWKIVPDGSVANGFEVVSPILSGEAGIEQVKRVAAILVAAGAEADRSCGLHVHVDARDMDIRSIVNVARRYARFESEINAFTPRARINGEYCKSMSNMAHNFDNIERAGIHELGGLNRYYAVNISAYARHGTIEFRQHSGTTSAEKMENWIRFCTAFVEASILPMVAGATRPAQTIDF